MQNYAFIKQNIKLFGFVFMIMLGLISLSACSPIGVVVGAGATAGTMALEERGIEQSARDKLAELRLLKVLTKKDLTLYSRISIEIVEGRALVIGRVATEQDREHLIATIWADENTVEVINQVTIGDTLDIKQTGYDLTIFTKIKTALLRDMEIKAVNYSFEVFEGQVYIIGIAESQNELNAVINHINAVERVRSVRQFVQIKNSPERIETLKALTTRRLEFDKNN